MARFVRKVNDEKPDYFTREILDEAFMELKADRYPRFVCVNKDGLVFQKDELIVRDPRGTRHIFKAVSVVPLDSSLFSEEMLYGISPSIALKYTTYTYIEVYRRPY